MLSYRVARTSKITPAKLRKLKEMSAQGASLRAIAAELGVTSPTILSWKRRYLASAGTERVESAEGPELPELPSEPADGELEALSRVLESWLADALGSVGSALSASTWTRIAAYADDAAARLHAMQQPPREIDQHDAQAKEDELIDYLRACLATPPGQPLPKRAATPSIASEPSPETPALRSLRARYDRMVSRMIAMRNEVDDGASLPNDLVALLKYEAVLQARIESLSPAPEDPNESPHIVANAPILAERIASLRANIRG